MGLEMLNLCKTMNGLIDEEKANPLERVIETTIWSHYYTSILKVIAERKLILIWINQSYLYYDFYALFQQIEDAITREFQLLKDVYRRTSLEIDEGIKTSIKQIHKTGDSSSGISPIRRTSKNWILNSKNTTLLANIIWVWVSREL